MRISDPVVDAALDTLLRSRAQVQKTLRLLSQTRSRIAACRRQLNPAFALTGGSDDERVRALVRARLSTGMLWPVDGSFSWSGCGRGKACAVCGSPVGGVEVEYEVEGPDGPVVAHLVCFFVWHGESMSLKRGMPRAS